MAETNRSYKQVNSLNSNDVTKNNKGETDKMVINGMEKHPPNMI